MRIGILAAALVCIGIANAQADPKTIQVRGEKTVTIPAEEARFSFTIEGDGKDLREAYAAAQAYLSQIYVALLAVGLDTTALQQSQVHVGDYRKWVVSKKAKSVVYSEVTVCDLNRLEEVMTVMAEFNVKDLSNVWFSLREPDALKRKAYEAAVKDARENAWVVAKSAGLVLGSVVSVEEPMESSSSRGVYADRIASFGFNSDYGSAQEALPRVLPMEISSSKVLLVTFSVE